MILCIRKEALARKNEVQKDIDLNYIFTEEIKYFDTYIEALEYGYIPLDVSVSIRSTYSNLVLENEEGLYYTNLTCLDKFVHKGLDLLMYITSIGVIKNIDYKAGFDDIMMKYSQFIPIGVYNPAPEDFNPIFYTQVILADEGAEKLKDYLLEGRKFVPISEMKKKGNIKQLLKELIIVKEEDHNATDDND